MALAALAAVAAAAATAQGSAGLPHQFEGYVSIDGRHNSARIVVMGFVNGQQCGVTSTSSFIYVLQVPTVCAKNGDTVRFHVDYGGDLYTAAQTSIFAAGIYSPLNLTVSTVVDDGDMDDDMPDDNMCLDDRCPWPDGPCEPGFEDEPAEPNFADIEVTLWRSVADPSVLYLSTRPTGGSWHTEQAPLDMSRRSRSEIFHQSNPITVTVPLTSDCRTNIEIMVWRSVADPSILYLSTRPKDGSWRTEQAPLDMSRLSRSGRFHQSNPITVEVPAPVRPTPTPTPRPTRTPTPTPTPTLTPAGPTWAQMDSLQVRVFEYWNPTVDAVDVLADSWNNVNDTIPSDRLANIARQERDLVQSMVNRLIALRPDPSTQNATMSRYLESAISYWSSGVSHATELEWYALARVTWGSVLWKRFYVKEAYVEYRRAKCSVWRLLYTNPEVACDEVAGAERDAAEAEAEARAWRPPPVVTLPPAPTPVVTPPPAAPVRRNFLSARQAQEYVRGAMERGEVAGCWPRDDRVGSGVGHTYFRNDGVWVIWWAAGSQRSAFLTYLTDATGHILVAGDGCPRRR